MSSVNPISCITVLQLYRKKGIGLLMYIIVLCKRATASVITGKCYAT